MYSDFDREVGEARVEQERQSRVDDVRAKLVRAGTLECIDCQSTISLARRRAYPAATRCAECQTDFEREVCRR